MLFASAARRPLFALGILFFLALQYRGAKDDSSCWIGGEHEDKYAPRTISSSGIGGPDQRPAELKEKITIVVLTVSEDRWIDVKDIMKVAAEHKLVEEMILIWNEPKDLAGYTVIQKKLEAFPGKSQIRLLMSPRNTLNIRYDPRFLKIRTGAVIILDDDLSIIPQTIDCMHESWLTDKTRIHSFGEPRAVYKSTGYTKSAKGLQKNFLLPRNIFDPMYLDIYSDPTNQAIRQYVDSQDAHCDDVAFASIATKYTQSSLVKVVAPNAHRTKRGSNLWSNVRAKDKVSKEKYKNIGISSSHTRNQRELQRAECSRAIIDMLNWTMPPIETSTTSQCSYYRDETATTTTTPKTNTTHTNRSH